MNFSNKCKSSFLSILIIGLSCGLVLSHNSLSAAEKSSPITMVVMDPLAAPLACECVEGYAQRKYEVLGKYLEKKLGEKVEVVFDASLTNLLKEKTIQRADIVIGKHSVILSDITKNNLSMMPIASLTDKEGSLTQHGLLVVWKEDNAKKVADLEDYRVLLGPKDSEEKHSAALDLLKVHKVSAPKDIEICTACSDSACKIVELKKGEKAVATISSYAKPLLEGCGTIKKGDLRVVGKTEPVPFVSAFMNNSLPSEKKKIIKEALWSTAEKPGICEALESAFGFIEYEAPNSEKKASVKKKSSS